MNETGNVLIIRVRNVPNGQIAHTLPKLDRCCKLDETASSEPLHFTGKDGIKRISCDIDKREFLREYVKQRRVVILEGCQEEWPARYWTFKGTGIHNKE